MLGLGTDPYAVVIAKVFLLAEDQYDLLFNVDSRASEHRSRVRMHGLEPLQNEIKWNGLLDLQLHRMKLRSRSGRASMVQAACRDAGAAFADPVVVVEAAEHGKSDEEKQRRAAEAHAAEH